MTWRERLAEAVFGDVIARRVQEATESDAGWRTLAGGVARDLPYSEFRESLATADDAYRHNPLAFRIVELTVDYVLGRGLTPRSSDERAQAWLERWWSHPLNRWPIRQFDLGRELSLAGEVFVTFHTNPLDGMTYVRQVPAALIDQIETRAEDVEAETSFHETGRVAVADGVRWSGSEQIDPAGRWWPREAASTDEPTMRHYAINRLAGTVRGMGDLAVLLPWLRRYKDWLTDRVRLNKYRQAFLFDVTIQGADRRALVARKNELGVPPEPGSLIVHNEKETWATVRPDVGGDDAAADGLALRLMLAVGSGYPLHFLAEAEHANLATATAMEEPTIRKLERRQLYFGWLVSDVAREALRRSGRFGDALDVDVRVEFEAMRTEDRERAAAAARSMAEALRMAREMGWIQDDEARETFGRFAGG